MRSVRLARLLCSMFFTQTLLPTVLYGWNPQFKKQLTMPQCLVMN